MKLMPQRRIARRENTNWSDRLFFFFLLSPVFFLEVEDDKDVFPASVFGFTVSRLDDRRLPIFT
jgi:hypothetical protein